MKALLSIWLFLLACLRPAAADADGDAGSGDDPTGGDDPAGAGDDPNAGDDDPLAALNDDPNAGDPVDYKAQFEQERTERQRAERELQEARAGHHAPVRQADPVWEEEERVLKDPKSTDLDKWRVNSSRTIRDAHQTAAQARAESMDSSDRTAFSYLSIAKPELHKRYSERVEKEYQRVRTMGQFVSRENIMKLMIGDDAMKGALKRKAPAQGKQPDQGVPRGKLPGARSDTNGKAGQTEHQKRVARLQNQHI